MEWSTFDALALGLVVGYYLYPISRIVAKIVRNAWNNTHKGE